jgi:beta-lactamase regulating signal transducer with metallopeptidase domain
MNTLELSTLVDAVGWGLVHSVWQCAAAAVVLAAALRLARGAAASVRYTLACGALIACVVLPVATVQRQLDVATPRYEAARTATAHVVPDAGFVPSDMMPARSVTMTATSPAVDLTQALRMLVLAWTGGVAVAGACHLVGYVRVGRLRTRGAEPLPQAWMDVVRGLAGRMAVGRPLRVLVAATGLESPVVIGMVKPVILMPVGMLTGLPARQVEAILAHELAHLRRWDDVANALQIAVETLMFYHPAVWWISKTIRQEREHCCDDVAADECGDAVVYAEALAALEARRQPRVALGIAGGGERLIDRIRRVLGRQERGGDGRGTWSVANSLAAVACCLLPLAVAGACGTHGGRGTTAAAKDAPVQPVPALREADDLRAVRVDSSTAEYQTTTLPPPAQPAKPAVPAAAPRKPGTRFEAVTVPAPDGKPGTAWRPVKVPAVDGRPMVLVAPKGPTTGPAGKGVWGVRAAKRVREMQVVVSADRMTLDGRDASWEDVERRVKELPEAEQRRAVLRIGVASPEVTVGRLDEAQAMGHALVRKYGMGYVSYVGVQPLTGPATRPAGATDGGDEAGRARDVEARAREAEDRAREARDRAREAEDRAREGQDRARAGSERVMAQMERVREDVERHRAAASEAAGKAMERAASDSERQLRELRVKGFPEGRERLASAKAATEAFGRTLKERSPTIEGAPVGAGSELDAELAQAERDLQAARQLGYGENHPTVIGARHRVEDLRRKVYEIAKDRDAAGRKGAAGAYYVGGTVQKQGAYVLTGQPVTVKQAIVSAGMVEGGAKEYYVSVVRREGNAERFLMRGVSLGKLFNGEIPDTTVRAGDVVMVTDGTTTAGPATSPATWPTAAAAPAEGAGKLFRFEHTFKRTTTRPTTEPMSMLWQGKLEINARSLEFEFK